MLLLTENRTAGTIILVAEGIKTGKMTSWNAFRTYKILYSYRALEKRIDSENFVKVSSSPGGFLNFYLTNHKSQITHQRNALFFSLFIL
jgi:hypothetical protein